MDPTTADVTLDGLVPRPSPVRNMALLAVGALLLAAVWVSPPIRNHSLGSIDSESLERLSSHRYVLSTLQLRPNGWPRVTIDSVSDVPGASVAGAWVTPIGYGSDSGADSADFATARDYVEAVTGATNDHILPISVDSGTPATMVILWRIDDCELLTDTARVVVELKTVFGSTETQILGDQGIGLESPAFSVESLVDEGICP